MRAGHCHSPASVHAVKKLLASLRNGEKDAEKFWLELYGRLIYIRYLAAVYTNGYRATTKGAENITGIRRLEGEKRLIEE